MGPHRAIAVAVPAWRLSVTATQCWLSRFNAFDFLRGFDKCA